MKETTAIAVFALSSMCAVILGLETIHYVVESVPVRCKVDGNLVYEGRSACINVTSSGASTTVSVKGGFLCLFPKQYFVSKNVELITEDKGEIK